MIKRSANTIRGFTLIELIMVMVILAIAVGAVAPTLRTFTEGRKTKDAASQIVGLAAYARTQSISEGRIYRMYFDATDRQYWLAADNGGSFGPPTGDFGQKFATPANSRMQVDVTQAVTPLAEQDNLTQGMGSNQPKQDINPYVQFLPSGRTDPVKIILTDSLGTVIEIACQTPTEGFRIVPPAEMTQ
jgi:prepilin-type N-terminal cleavage/methylation domain-containing protein